MTDIHLNGRWLGQPFTGVQRYSEELASRVSAAEDIDVVLHVPKGGEVPSWAATHGVQVRHAPVSGIAYDQLYLLFASRGRTLVSFGGIPPMLKRKQVVTFHDATPFRHSRTFRFLFVAYYVVGFFVLSRVARQILTVSEFSRRELSEILRVNPSRFLVVPCAADLHVKHESAPPDMPCQAPSYLVVGTLAQHKNLARPVEALAASGRKVIIVGAAGRASVFTQQVSSFGPSVTVARRLSDGELRWLYENSQALIFPSFYEGFGLPVLEAQTLGCPVIASNAASIPEVGGDAALYFDPADPADLLRQVDALEGDAAIRERLITQGHRNSRRFDWQMSADRVLQWLRSNG